MRRPVTDEGNTVRARRPTKAVRQLATSAADDRQARFRKLAYRLVACVEPEEQELLKQEIVRFVLTRARSNPRSA